MLIQVHLILCPSYSWSILSFVHPIPIPRIFLVYLIPKQSYPWFTLFHVPYPCSILSLVHTIPGPPITSPPYPWSILSLVHISLAHISLIHISLVHPIPGPPYH